MTDLPLQPHAAYSIRDNVISVEILITPKIQPGHRAPQMGKTPEFDQACGLAYLAPGHLAVGAMRCIGIGRRIIVSYGFEVCRYPVHEGKWEIQADM
jgi:hypothetical protein